MKTMTCRSEGESMKTVLMIAAILSLLGCLCESRKGWYVALFVASVILYMVIGAAPML